MSARKPKHDYDSEEFYTTLRKYASICFIDKQVAALLDLTLEVFSAMKNGNYAGWTEEENKRRGERISNVLEQARAQNVLTAKNAMYRLGIGYKTHSVSTRTAAVHCPSCHGKKPNPTCPECAGKGWITDPDGELIVTETDTDLPPNMQALSNWLFHHDPEWRKKERGQDEEASDVPTDIEEGINIGEWIKQEVKVHGSKDGQ